MFSENKSNESIGLCSIRIQLSSMPLELQQSQKGIGIKYIETH